MLRAHCAMWMDQRRRDWNPGRRSCQARTNTLRVPNGLYCTKLSSNGLAGSVDFTQLSRLDDTEYFYSQASKSF